MATLPSNEPAPSSSQQRLLWVRHPADVARMVLAAVVWLVVGGLALSYPDDARGVSTRVVIAVNGLPDALAIFLVGIVQLAAVVAPLGALLLVRKGRWRELALAAGAAAATAAVAALLDGSLSHGVAEAILTDAERPSWITGSAFPSGAYLAAVAAAATVLAPTLARSWRRLIWLAVAVVAVARVITAVESPVGLTSSVAAGVFVGSLAMVVFRAPLRWPAADSVGAALERAGVAVRSIRPTAERHRHGPTYEVVAADGREVFAKVVGKDERDAEVLAQLVRAVRVSGPEDRRSRGAAETLAHEGLALSLAARASVSVPGLVAVTQTDDKASVLVTERLAGRTFDEVEDVTDELAGAAFAQLAALHRARIAHGWPSLHHLFARSDGQVSLLDLRWSTPAATDLVLAKDLAEALMAVAGAIGVARTVTAALGSFDPARLGEALPLLQPLAVSPETRAALKADHDLLPALREAVQDAAGVEAYELVKLERLNLKKVVTFVGTLVMANILLSVLGNVGEIWDAVKDANPAYLPLVALLPMLVYPAGALSLMGAVPGRLPLWLTTKVMFAQSFLNRFTPANAGGMALRARYLQRNGIPLVNAASSVAITSAASGVMQVVLAIVLFTWAGRSAGPSGFSMPSGVAIAFVVVGVLALGGIAYATAFGRKLLQQLKVNLLSVVRDLAALGKQPSKLVMLFGGALGSKVVTIAVFIVTMRAFGMDGSIPVVGAMYLTANTIASAAPTPGGVGAIEAALAAGLVGLGEDSGAAAAVVLVFRLFTYWLPILPCWFFLTRIQAADAV